MPTSHKSIQRVMDAAIAFAADTITRIERQGGPRGYGQTMLLIRHTEFLKSAAPEMLKAIQKEK